MLHTNYTTIIETTPDLLWRIIGNFRVYEWGEGVEPGFIEGGRPDNEIGAIRSFRYYGMPSRQRLTAYSAIDYTYSLESCAAYDTIDYYRVRISIQPATGGHSKVTWAASYEAPLQEAEKWDEFFRIEFVKSLEKLRAIACSPAMPIAW